MTGDARSDRWARVKEIFHAAIEQAPAERAAYVQRVCGTDDSLSADVGRLLAAHCQAADFLERAPASFTGRRIGRYEIGELIGQGGMGEVYAARDTELDRDVAIKIGRSVDGDERLRREAQHAARLNHPNICTIHEVGVFEGRCYIVMERVAGRRLSDVIPPGGLSIEDVLRYAAQVADAIGHAHRHGVIHRDLKPTNIVVTPDGRAKVLDFGLAQTVRSDANTGRTGTGSAFTVEGVPAGTLAYMAPELLCGKRADRRSDIWAFGVLLYEMANGARPFSGSTDFELCASILHKTPAPLPTAIPAPLKTVIERCLEKDSRKRYPSVDSVATVLGEAAGFWGAPVFSLSRIFSSVPHWRIRAALLALVLLVAGGVIAWLEWGSRRPALTLGAAGRPSVAVLPFDDLTDAGDTAWLANGIQMMLLTGLAETPALDVVGSHRLQQVVRDTGAPDLKSLDRDQAADIARRAGAGAVIAGSIVRIGGTFRVDAQIEDLSRGRVLAATTVSGTDLFALVDQLTVQIRERVGLREPATARSIADVSSRSLDAYRLYSAGVDEFSNFRSDAAQQLLERAVGIDPTFADAYLQLALIAGPAGRPRDRGGYLRKAAEHRERLSDRRRLVMEAELARDEGRFTDAARRLDELVERFPDVEAISTLGLQLHTPVVGPLPDAKRLLDIERAAVASNPTSPYARNSFAYALMYAGRFNDAIGELETAARLAPRQPAPHDGLGEVYLLMGAAQQAMESFSRALAIDPMFPFSRRGRAWTLAVTGRLDDALEEQISVPYLSAVMLARAGRFREATDTISAAVRSAEEGGDNARVVGLHLLSAMLALERTDYDQALGHCRASRPILMSLPAERARFITALAELLQGVAEARRGRLREARAHLEAQQRIGPSSAEAWWHRLLEGEIALAAGDLDHAAAAFSRATPPRKQFFSGLVEGSVLSNDLPFRDGLARTAIARGDVQGALDIYRRLLNYDADQRWVAVFAPRYVLEIARLLEKAGDKPAARAEYERFLMFWRQADARLPERAEAQRAVQRLR